MKTVEEKQAALEQTRISKEEVGKRVTTNGVEELGHLGGQDQAACSCDPGCQQPTDQHHPQIHAQGPTEGNRIGAHELDCILQCCTHSYTGPDRQGKGGREGSTRFMGAGEEITGTT